MLILIAIGASLFFALDLQRFLSLSTVKDSHDALVASYRAQPLLFVLAFMGIHVVALALCLPGAVLTAALAGGAIFGPLPGTAIVLTSLTIGDSLGFLAARFLIGDWVKARFGRQFDKVEAEMRRNGAFYLLSLRLMAAVPFFIVNLTFGAARMPLRIFAPISFIGLIPATALYVNAGTQLAAIEGPGDVMSLPMLLSLGALAIVPLILRFTINRTTAPRPGL